MNDQVYFVKCPECGNEQGDLGRNVKCEECGYWPMPFIPNDPIEDKIAKAREDGFTQGVAYALGTLNRNHDQPNMCAEVLRTLGKVTSTTLRTAGVSKYDIESLVPVLRIVRRLP